MSARKSSYSLLYILMSFLVGCIKAGLVAVTLTRPSDEPATAPVAASQAEDGGIFDPAIMLPSWNVDSPALAALVAYVDDVCDSSSPNYVEPADRIATFDMDGTVLCEKAPVYLDYCMMMHRVLEDPT